MSILDDPKMMRDIIMDHYEYPHNKKLKNDTRYIKVHMDSESCIDDIYVEALIENNLVKGREFYASALNGIDSFDVRSYKSSQYRKLGIKLFEQFFRQKIQ